MGEWNPKRGIRLVPVPSQDSNIVYAAEVAVNHEPFHEAARNEAMQKSASTVAIDKKKPKHKETKPVKASQAHVEYKYVLGDPGDEFFQWEGGENRTLDWSIQDSKGNDVATVVSIRESGLGTDRKERVLSNVPLIK